MASVPSTSVDAESRRFARTCGVLVLACAVAVALAVTLPGVALVVAGSITWMVLFVVAWMLPPPPTTLAMGRVLAGLSLAVLVVAMGVAGVVAGVLG